MGSFAWDTSSIGWSSFGGKKQEQELDISSSIRTGCNDGAFKASM
jgi:hypothetical protein